jgi:hypothetical protein
LFGAHQPGAGVVSGLPDASDARSPAASVDFVAKLAELRSRKAQAAGTAEKDWPADVLLPVLWDGSISETAGAVNEACDSIDIFEVYERLSKGKYGDRQQVAAGQREVMISCPTREHADIHPSASINRQEQLWHCHACVVGGDKFTMAGHALGLDSKRDLWKIKVLMAEQLRGVKYARPFAAAPASSHSPSAKGGWGDQSVPAAIGVDQWEAAVEEQKTKTLIRLEGDHRARQERAAGLFVPPRFVDDLEAELAQPDPEIEWTIEGLHSVGGNTTLTAGFKVGKTTFVMNLVKALADHENFLGEHDVRNLEGRIALWNFEVDEIQMKRNFRDITLKKAANVWHLPLRGHNLNIMDDAAYSWALRELRIQEIEVLILDPFSGAYYGDENDNSQINAFTKRLDQLKREAGVKDLFMPVHTGRFVEEGNERARGGAKLDDWADTRWVLAKHPQTADRYFKAEGRRVQQDERELCFDPATSALSYSTFKGTRKQKAGSVVKADVMTYIGTHPGCSKTAIEQAIGGKAEVVRTAIGQLARDLDVVVVPGRNRTQHHYLHGQQPIGGGL